MSAENRIKYLEMQLAYKDQEIEFLKKIVSLNPETPE
ncbi:HTH domain-containing protein [[Ruminococcus] torques]